MAHPTRREVLVLGVSSLWASAWPSRTAAVSPDAGLVHYADERTYDIRHRVSVDTGEYQLTSLEIWLPVPTDDAEQMVRRLKVRPKVRLARDKNSLAKVAALSLKKFEPEPDQHFSLGLSYRLTCRKIVPNRRALSGYRLSEYTRDRQFRLFTRPEKKLDTANPEIAKRAGQFQARYPNPVDLARAVYDWVLDHVRYRLIEGFGGAVYCLENAHGECGDYSALFVTLLRAAGVPARPVSGFWADKRDGWHCWAQFMLPSGEWLPVDCSLGDQNWFRRKYYFGAMDNRRVALCKTHDVELVGRRNGHREVEFLQTGVWWWQGDELSREARRPKAVFSVSGRLVSE